MITPFSLTLWGKLPQFEVPLSVVPDGHLTLKPNALAILMVLLESAKAGQRTNRQPTVEVRISQKTLEERSGFSKNTITQGMDGLEQIGFIQRVPSRRKYGEFGANVYVICDSRTGEPLRASGRNFYFGNSLPYMRVPVALVRDSDASWSLAKLSGSEIRMYGTLCWLANKHRNNQFQTTQSELKSIAGFSTLPTMQRALEQLNDKCLVCTSQSGTDLEVGMLDPYTGELPHRETDEPTDNPANYFAVAERGRARRLNLNVGNPEEIKKIVRGCLRDGEPVVDQKNGNIKIRCPFHPDSNPSCSVNPTRRIFHCFGCHEKGTFTQLLMKLCGVTQGEAIRIMGQATGASVDYHPPDKSAEAIYSYEDANGKLVKQVLRYPDKRFSQRRPSKNGGWTWNASNVQPILYNLMRVSFAGTVCICEGEKDCETFMSLSLHPTEGGDVVATTSGGAESWHDSLADDLREKRVVLMPDADEPGGRFAEKVAASLAQRGIEYRTVTFGDVGAKDLSDFVGGGHSKEELVERVGSDWLSVVETPLVGTPTEFEPA